MFRDRFTTPFLISLTTLSLLYTLYKVIITPREITMGIVQKIFYLHMPVAVFSLLLLLGGTICSIIYLIKKSDQIDRFASTAIEVGMLWSTYVLISGSIWAKEAWNAWWVWEPRLTFVLIMWLTFGVYLMIRLIDHNQQIKKVAAIFALLGGLNIPLIHISVQKFGGVHPQLDRDQGGMVLESSMKETLFASFITITLLTLLLLILSYRSKKYDGAPR